MKRPCLPGQEDWGEFVRLETARLYRILAGAKLQPDQLEEIVQEVWLQVIQQQDKFQGEDAVDRLRRWMSGVARNKKSDLIRQRRRHPTLSLGDLAAEPIAPEEAESAIRQEQGRERELFREWLGELRGKDDLNYRLVHGRYVEGRTVEALADEIGTGGHVVSCRLHRQIRKFIAWVALHAVGGNAAP